MARPATAPNPVRSMNHCLCSGQLERPPQTEYSFSNHEHVAGRGRDYRAMDGTLVPRALLKREGHREIGARFELADSQAKAGVTPKHSSV